MTLEQKKEKLEKALSNPQVTAEQKAIFEKALDKIEEELSATKTTTKVVKKKRIYKKDFYAKAIKEYPDITLNEVLAYSKSKYNALLKNLEKMASDMGVAKTNVKDYAKSFIDVHIPKGVTTTKPKSRNKQRAALAADAAVFLDGEAPKGIEAFKLFVLNNIGNKLYQIYKIEQEDKSIKVFQEELTIASTSDEYFIRKLKHQKVDAPFYYSSIVHSNPVFTKDYIEYGARAHRNRLLYRQPKGFKLGISISPAGEANKPITSKAKPAVKKATPVKAKEKAYFSWRKKEDIKALERIEINSKHYGKKVEEDTPVKLKGEGKESIDLVAKKGEYLIFDEKGYLVYVMNASSYKAKVQPIKPTGKAKKDCHTCETKVASTTKKRSSCTLKNGEDGRRLTKAVQFFIDQADDWHNSKTSQKITKVMRTKGEKQKVIVEIADYEGFATGLATLVGGKRKYYELCIDSGELTPSKKPGNGKYNVVVSAAEMKKVYTTKGDKTYKVCLDTYRKLIKCSLQGTCSTADAAKWKELYQSCGDLRQKLEENPQVLRNFHIEVKKRRRPNEKYSDAMRRVAVALKNRL